MDQGRVFTDSSSYDDLEEHWWWFVNLGGGGEELLLPRALPRVSLSTSISLSLRFGLTHSSKRTHTTRSLSFFLSWWFWRRRRWQFPSSPAPGQFMKLGCYIATVYNITFKISSFSLFLPPSTAGALLTTPPSLSPLSLFLSRSTASRCRRFFSLNVRLRRGLDSSDKAEHNADL
ncbi:hypothetical protein PIB30_017827 [Stylosanthes scabra]|uniref:Uncharacterized protein n=1 Tax=Stylosanthes scabra TaxID=79078 RepID=A0ABU6V8K9_9FABA|nr:hypothetical protein [Stylosanthes scabra]